MPKGPRTSRFRALAAAAGLSAVLVCGCSRAAPGEGAEQGNLVVIVVDTLRADFGGAKTPHIDQLGRDGIAFDLAFRHAPITLPAHTALFSSRHPFLTGVTNNGQPVPRQVPVLSEWLAAHGYRTAAAVSLASLWPVSAGRGVDRDAGRGREPQSLVDGPQPLVRHGVGAGRRWRGSTARCSR